MENRNLSIMFTDMKGFTLRTSSQRRDETLHMIKQHKEILLPVIVRFGGRLIKTIGDAFLVVFESPTDAVLAGIALQETLRQHNSAASPQERIEVRISINSGEVILEEDDVYGEAVNIASRVQGVSEPNEVYFTEATYLSMNKSEVPSSEIGYRILKGLPQKVKLYKVLRESGMSKDLSAAGGTRIPYAPSAIAPTWRRVGAFAADLAILGLLTALLFVIPFSRQAGKGWELRVWADTWAAQPKSVSSDSTGSPKEEIVTLQKELETERKQVEIKKRDLEASQIELDQKRKLLDRDEELFNQKSEQIESPETDEALIREETELRRQRNLLDKEQDDLDRTVSALENEEGSLSERESALQEKTDQISELAEQAADSIEALTPETMRIMLWGAGPVPEGFSRYGEVMEFRDRHSALAREDKILGITFLISGILLFLIYHTVFFTRNAQTPGKKFFKLKVCSEDGQPMKLGRAFFRSFFYLISALPLGLGFFWISFDVKHRTWHDKFTGTKVILAS